MENEKFQELMLEQFAKLFREFQELKTNQNRFESELQDVKTSQNRFESEIKNVKEIVLKIEHNHGGKIDALFDDRQIQKETNEQIFSTLERLEAKIDVLQMETAHIRRIK